MDFVCYVWCPFFEFWLFIIPWYIIPQYLSLNALTERYADKPFKIIGFPCNQFLRQVRETEIDVQIKISIRILKNIQEPGANASEIFASLKHVRPGHGFVPNFEMFAKTDVSMDNKLSTSSTLNMSKWVNKMS